MRKVTYFYAYLQRMSREGEMCIEGSRKDKPWRYLSIANNLYCVITFQLKRRVVWMSAELCQLILDEAVVVILKIRCVPYILSLH